MIEIGRYKFLLKLTCKYKLDEFVNLKYDMLINIT